jgi:hypothetical protein
MTQVNDAEKGSEMNFKISREGFLNLIAQNDAQKGRNFQSEVRRFVKEIVGENHNVEVRSEFPLQGLSAQWKLDIVVVGKLIFTGEFSTYLAIVSCKHVKENPKNKATYWTEMSRTYMELNDLQLNSELSKPKFFLVVNRHCMKGEVDKNYPALFKNIGVEMINFNDHEERKTFAKHLQQLLSEANPSEQIKKFEKAVKETHKT